MEVRIERRFELPTVDAAQAWALLSDLPAAATCMPGVQITGRQGDQGWAGTMQARVGPASMRFKGQVDVQSTDPVERSVHMVGKGGDGAGSSAVLDLQARVEQAAAGCALVSCATVSVSGRLAQFGSRLLLPVADNLMRQFVGAFEARAATIVPVQAVQAPSAAVAPSAPAGDAGLPAAGRGAALNLRALAWSVLRDWIASRFRRGRGGG